MGDQDILHHFDLPYPSFELSGYLQSMAAPAEVVAGIIQPHCPLRDYPHFPLTLHTDDEEEGRCVALREFLLMEASTLLNRCCAALRRDGLFPVSLIVSAVVAVFTKIPLAKLSQIHRRAISCYDPDYLSWDKRFREYLNLIQEAQNNPKRQKARLETTVFEYPSKDDLLVLAENLIDLKTVPSTKMTVSGLSKLEFDRWIEFQRDLVKDRLEPTRLWKSPYFKEGELVKDHLPEDFRHTLFPSKKRKDKRLNFIRELHSLVVADFCKHRRIGKKAYLREYYPKLMVCRGGQGYRPEESTLNKWLEAGQVKKWLADHPEIRSTQ